MLLWLAKFSNWFSVLNVFHYTTFRAVMAALTALAFSLMLGPWTIRKLTALKAGQAIRIEPAHRRVVPPLSASTTDAAPELEHVLQEARYTDV